MTTELVRQPISELSTLVRSRQVSPRELVKSYLDAIDRLDAVLNVYITVCADQALAAADRAERDIAAGRYLGPLHGIPISHKDLSCTRGVATTGNSRALRDHIPDYDATHVRRLADAGMILLGKTTTSEYGCGGFGLSGTARNPWNTDYFTGGSSAGSAGGVAAGLAAAATGTDTGGSVRVPASFCGLVGLKPTYGRVSRYGVIPLSWSMDHLGPITRTVRDSAMLLNAMAGHDPLDASSLPAAVPDFTAGLGRSIEGMVLGVPRQHYFDNLDPDVENAVRAALACFEELGARLETVDLERAGELAAAGTVMMMSEAFGQHAAPLREKGHEYTERGRRRISTGAFYTASEYQQAGQIRQLWLHELEAVIGRVDALVMPTLPHTAFTVEDLEAGPPDTSWGTRQFSLSGHPAITIPCGFDQAGMPIGLQLATGSLQEQRLFQIAHAYQQATDWHRRRSTLPSN